MSERMPMTGDAKAWRSEKSEPRAPPRRTISYRSLIGFAKEFLYVFRPVRIWLRTEEEDASRAVS